MTRLSAIATESSFSGHPPGGPASRSARIQATARAASASARRPGNSVVSATKSTWTTFATQVPLVVRYVRTSAARPKASPTLRSRPSSLRVTKKGQATGAIATLSATPPAPAASSAAGRQPDQRRSA